jgi:hypothetical protein
MPLVLNTFDTGVATALQERLRGYLVGLGDECRATVVGQFETEAQVSPLVVVSPTELEEMVYQSGHYRVAVEVTVKVDMDSGSGGQFLLLSGAVLDCLQQTDLVAQLNAVQDATGRALCVVQGLVLEQSRLEDIGDRQWRRVYSLNVFGFNPAG